MAFNANQIWDVRTTGSDANGGGFNPANSNFPTDLTTDTNTANTASPVVSSASYNFVAGDVGAWVFIKSGTNWIPGWYQIASVGSNKATLTASIGSAYEMVNNTAARRNTAVGVATVGTPTSGTWGVDYSQQDAAKIAFTDMVIDGTTNTIFSSAANPVGKNFVGNTINITSGTGFTVQRVEVVSTSGTNATCDKSLGTLSSTGGNGNLGGSLATPGMAGGLKIAGNDIYVKSGTYSLSGNTVNTSGCQISDTTGGVDGTNPTWWVGWDTDRFLYNTNATRPTINANLQTSLTLFICAAAYSRIRNFIVDGNTKASITGFNTAGSYSKCEYLKAMNCTVIGIDAVGGNDAVIRGCEATGCSGTAAFRLAQSSSVDVIGCEAYDNTTIGFSASFVAMFLWCIADSNSGGSSYGFSFDSVGCTAYNCVAYNNGSHGFVSSNSIGAITLINCIAEANAAFGYSTGAVRGLVQLYKCAGYNNTSSNFTVTNLLDVEGFVAGTSGSFFNDAAAGDFSLNSISGRGALLRGTGFPGVMPRGTTTGYQDIGAAQTITEIINNIKFIGART